ncbi:MAG: hypothetical protein U9N72_05045, partial [Bacteroidota bacterium]|nr:hypothetical protein [Bacteroidota bacterium]
FDASTSPSINSGQAQHRLVTNMLADSLPPSLYELRRTGQGSLGSGMIWVLSQNGLSPRWNLIGLWNNF